MHEAWWSRAKNDADKRRTRGSSFRAATSSARNERTSRLWARAALLEHAAAPGQARAAPVEHSAAPGQTRAAHFEYSAVPGRLERRLSRILQLHAKLERHPSSILRLRGRLERPFRAICGPGAGSSGHFEPSAAPGQARAATYSSHLRPRGGLERPFRAICGSGPGSLGCRAVAILSCS